MTFKSDIAIAQDAPIKHIKSIAAELQLDENDIIFYGQSKAKVDLAARSLQTAPLNGKLILVTAINPTPAGEGKTTTTIGLGDAFKQLCKKVVIALREPSLGPVFGVKGGATGGGMAQVIPMEEINLHFTGDFHAISAANNLLAALLDNHIFHGNALNIDTKKIHWKRCVDMNDRQLRNVIDGLGTANGVVREDGFDITVASEIMAILCLSENLSDLKSRLDKIVVAYSTNNEPITAAQLNATGAMAILLKEAIHPNLVQTLEHTPTLIHGGPFANIAHGCNSVIATKLGMKLADYVVTEAGFGADLGLEKFIDIKCRSANIYPSSVVIVATVRALKHHGGASKVQLSTENSLALERGIPHLIRHIDNIKNVYKLPVIVAINRFPTDTDLEISTIINACATVNTTAILSEAWAKGGQGATALASELIKLCETSTAVSYCYELSDTLVDKVNKVVKQIYHGSHATFTPQALQQLKLIEKQNLAHLPVCIAKTPYSFSDDPTLIGTPENFEVTIREIKLSAGAGFIVALAGTILTMPGLPKIPAAEQMDIDNNAKIIGLS